MEWTRRQALGGMGAAALAGLTGSAGTLRAMSIGTKELLSISDGNLVLPASMFFEGLPQDELQSILSQHGQTGDQLSPPCNLTLLRQGDQTILFDAGSGPTFMDSAGVMLDSLDAVGVAPEDVTHVVFTHAHPDHLWGILDDFDDPIFPDAQMMMGQVEWDYWTDPDTVTTIGELRASFAVGAARRLEAIAEQMRFIAGGEEILPGVMAHDTPGHTPGHMSFEVRDGGTAVLIGGDAIGNHHVAMARPDWASGSDQDAEMGAATRQRLLDQIVSDDMMLMGFHLPGGGLGRVSRAGDGYAFEPEAG